MELRRPPESAFERLPGHASTPRYLEVGGGVRLAYVEEGRPDEPAVLLLHGLPGWSYGYRRVIPILAEAGCRTIAPDLVGCGRSDQPRDAADHHLDAHVAWLGELLDALALREVALVADDVGVVIGLALLAAHPDRFDRAVLLDPCLPRADGALPATLARWVDLATRDASEVPAASSLIRERCGTPLAIQEAAGYDAPFGPGDLARTIAGLAGLLTRPLDRARHERMTLALAGLTGGVTLVEGDPDPRARAAAELVAQAVPGVRRVAGPVVELGRRAIAEDRGPELAAAILGALDARPA